MVTFMVKCAFATIPAAIIIFMICLFVLALSLRALRCRAMLIRLSEEEPRSQQCEPRRREIDSRR